MSKITELSQLAWAQVNEERAVLGCEPSTDSFSIDEIASFEQKLAALIIKECSDALTAEMNRLDGIEGRELSAQTMETASIIVKNCFNV